MNSAIIQFRANILRLRNIDHLYLSISAITTSVIDLSDLLRTELVMVVSALDHYIHEVTKLGIIESFEGRRLTTPALLKFPVSLNGAIQGMQTSGSSAWIEEEIRSKHSYLSFQQPDKIAEAIRLVSSIELWSCVGADMGIPASDIKRQIQLIVDRRNKIAHEADLDPSYPGTRWPIDKQMVSDAVDFIEHLCETIHRLIV